MASRGISTPLRRQPGNENFSPLRCDETPPFGAAHPMSSTRLGPRSAKPVLFLELQIRGRGSSFFFPPVGAGVSLDQAVRPILRSPVPECRHPIVELRCFWTRPIIMFRGRPPGRWPSRECRTPPPHHPPRFIEERMTRKWVAEGEGRLGELIGDGLGGVLKGTEGR